MCGGQAWLSPTKLCLRTPGSRGDNSRAVKHCWGRNRDGVPLPPSSIAIALENAEGHGCSIDFNLEFGRMWWKTQIVVSASAKAS